MTDARVARLQGWVPVAMDLRADRPWVQWTDLPRANLREPFFEHSVQAHLASADAERVMTPPEALSLVGDAAELVGPHGFVFHSARCGSTAAANALGAIDGALVLREPLAVSYALLGAAPSERAALVRGTIACLGHRFGPEHRRTFIKFSSWNVMFIELLRDLYPEVPCVFLYRDPIESLVSLVERPPNWAALFRDQLPFATDVGDPAALSKEAFLGHVLASMYAAAAGVSGLSAVNYADLVDDPVEHLETALSLNLGDEDRDRARASMSTYSKGTEDRAFQSDSAHKREAATEATKAAATLAAEAYAALESRRR